MRQVRSFRAHRIGLCQSQAIDLSTWYLSWRSPNTPYNLQIRLFSSKQLSLSINAVRAELQHKNIHASLLHFSEEDGRPHVLKYTTFLSLKLSKTDFAFVKIQKQHSVEPESTERRLALTHRIPKRRFLLCRSHILIIPLFWTSPERKHNHGAQLFSFIPWNRKYC
jgi:hypothetical protein